MTDAMPAGWLGRALKAKPIPGRLPKRDGRALQWVYKTVTKKNPLQLTFPSRCGRARDLSTGEADQGQIPYVLSAASVGRLLARSGILVETPLHRALERDEAIVQ